MPDHSSILPNEGQAQQIPTAVDQFISAMQSTGLTPPEDIIPDGEIHRFPRWQRSAGAS